MCVDSVEDFAWQVKLSILRSRIFKYLVTTHSKYVVMDSLQILVLIQRSWPLKRFKNSLNLNGQETGKKKGLQQADR